RRHRGDERVPRTLRRGPPDRSPTPPRHRSTGSPTEERHRLRLRVLRAKLRRRRHLGRGVSRIREGTKELTNRGTREQGNKETRKQGNKARKEQGTKAPKGRSGGRSERQTGRGSVHRGGGAGDELTRRPPPSPHPPPAPGGAKE